LNNVGDGIVVGKLDMAVEHNIFSNHRSDVFCIGWDAKRGPVVTIVAPSTSGYKASIYGSKSVIRVGVAATCVSKHTRVYSLFAPCPTNKISAVCSKFENDIKVWWQ
jgi:hypothetical protein